jgi:subtilisin
MASMKQQYVILPKRGFKSESMRTLFSGGGESDIHTASAELQFVPTFSILDSISLDGPKLAAMSAQKARELRQESDEFRLFPIRRYRPARRQVVLANRKASSRLGIELVEFILTIQDEETGSPLMGVDVTAIVDPAARTGDYGTTNARGQVRLHLPQKMPVRQLYVYPPSGYWGKYSENFASGIPAILSLKKIKPDYPDFLRQFYRTPRPGIGKGVRVAVIDTGVDPNHPELTLHLDKNCVFRENFENIPPSDGHGTHVAGIIAARNYGIAPEVDLCSYKVFPNTGSATNVDIARAIDQCVADGCDLINLSLESEKPDEVLHEAIGEAFEKGTICIVAAGNSHKKPVAYPAWFKRSIAVSALGKIGAYPPGSLEEADFSDPCSPVDPNIFFADFSNVGREIDACAPGVGIVSTWVGGGIAVESGTSMACPIVTGVIAALLSSQIEILSSQRDMFRACRIIGLFHRACQSIGLDPMYQGLGQILG